MGKSRSKLLLGLLGVLLVGLVLQYTIGGGWTELKRAIQRRQLSKETTGPWELPADFGPADAKVKVLVFVSAMNPCHKDYAEGIGNLLLDYQDRVRVEFKDMATGQTADLLRGYPIGCEMVLLLNGLNRIKLPWRKTPLDLQGPGGTEGASDETLGKIVEWALTEEGQKSLSHQRQVFEKERQKRIAKEKAQAEAARSKAAADAEKKAAESQAQPEQAEGHQSAPSSSQRTPPAPGGPPLRRPPTESPR